MAGLFSTAGGAKLGSDVVGVTVFRTVAALAVLGFLGVGSWLLDSEELGLLSLVLASSSIIGVAGCGGVLRDSVRVAELSATCSNWSILRRYIIKKSIYVYFVSFLLSAFVVSYFVSLPSIELHDVTFLLLVLVICQFKALTTYNAEVVRGAGFGRISTLVLEVIPYIFSCVLILWLFFRYPIGVNLIYVLSIFALANIASYIVSWVYINRIFSNLNAGNDSLPEPSSRFQYFLADAILSAQFQGHFFVVGSVLGEGAVGILMIAFRLAMIAGFPIDIINGTLPSVIARHLRTGRTAELSKLLSMFSSALLILVGLVFVSALFFGQLFFELFAEGSFNTYVSMMLILIGVLFNAGTGSAGRVLLLSQSPRILLYVSCWSVGVALAANFFLSINYGLIGGALAICVGMALHNVGMAICCMRLLNVKTYAGVVGLSELGWKARYFIEGRACRSALFGVVEKFIRTVEDLALSRAGIIVVECFGDSHSRVFRYINRLQKTLYFRSVVVQGATSRGLINLKSKTGSAKAYNYFLNNDKAKNRTLVLLFGEVDCGYLLWYSRGEDLADKIDKTLVAYENFISNASKDFDSICVVSVPRPVMPDGDRALNLVVERRDLSVSKDEVDSATKLFNRKLDVICTNLGVAYVDMDKFVAPFGEVGESFKSDKVGDHHYNRDAYAKAFLEAIREDYFLVNLSRKI